MLTICSLLHERFFGTVSSLCGYCVVHIAWHSTQWRTGRVGICGLRRCGWPPRLGCDARPTRTACRWFGGDWDAMGPCGSRILQRHLHPTSELSLPLPMPDSEVRPASYLLTLPSTRSPHLAIAFSTRHCKPDYITTISQHTH